MEQSVFYIHLRLGTHAKDLPIGLQAIPSSESHLVKLFHSKAAHPCRHALSLTHAQKAFA